MQAADQAGKLQALHGAAATIGWSWSGEPLSRHVPHQKLLPISFSSFDIVFHASSRRQKADCANACSNRQL
jgi:hypothetical protein